MASITILTQNCFLSRPMRELSDYFRRTKADVYCLQEVASLKKAKLFEIALDLPGKLTEPVFKSGLSVSLRCQTLTGLPVVKWGEIRFPNTRRPRIMPSAGKALWMDLAVGKKIIRIYNCHLAVIEQGMMERANIVRILTSHADKFLGPVIITGDMNTSVPEKGRGRPLIHVFYRVPHPPSHIGKYAVKSEKFYFNDVAKKHGFTEITDNFEPTWRMILTKREAFGGLKLDWMLHRGFKKTSYKLGPYIGDHRSILGKLWF